MPISSAADMDMKELADAPSQWIKEGTRCVGFTYAESADVSRSFFNRCEKPTKDGALYRMA